MVYGKGQAINELLNQVPAERILYFSFDETSANPKDVLKFYERNVLRKPFEEVDEVYVF